MSYAAHTSVMEREIVTALAPKDGGTYVDATFGGGGYTRAILRQAKCTVYGFDRDPTAIERAQSWIEEFDGQIILVERPFSEMKEAMDELGVDGVDGIVFDLGVSSMHLDQAERGFSFLRDGALSMRMDCGKPDAGDVIAQGSASDLAAIFRVYGEEKKAGLIAKAIIRARDNDPIMTTKQLAQIIETAAPQYGSKIHPATRVFQALRIFVNDEIGQLIEGLYAAEHLLKPEGRLVVVAFHSLEDRIVKRFLASRAETKNKGSRHLPPVEKASPSFSLLYAKPVGPQAGEVKENPRARSAKLRAGIRLDVPPMPANDDELGAPKTVRRNFLEEGLQT